jgi:hypothetical protein
MEFILERLGNDQFRLVKDEPSSKCVVDKLVELHTKNGPSQRSYLRKKLQNLQLESFADLKSLFLKHEAIMRDMEAANCNMSYEDKIHSLLESKPMKYEQIVNHFQLMNDEEFVKLSLASVKKKFLEAELKKR